MFKIWEVPAEKSTHQHGEAQNDTVYITRGAVDSVLPVPVSVTLQDVNCFYNRAAVWRGGNNTELLFENAIGIPGAMEIMLSFVELKPRVLLQVQEKLDAAPLAVTVDAAFQLAADETLQVLEELFGEDERRVLLQLGVGLGDDVVRAAVALGDGHHAIVVTQQAAFGAANSGEPATAQLDAIVIFSDNSIWDNHVGFGLYIVIYDTNGGPGQGRG